MNNKVSAYSVLDTNFATAWKVAEGLAGENGRFATIKDIIQARLNNDLDTEIWQRFYTTVSAEYIGYSKEGRLVAAIVHGTGPLTSLDNWIMAHNMKNEDKDCGYINIQMFHDLLDGKYGEVTIIDLSSYEVKNNDMPLLYTSASDEDEWVIARLGGDKAMVDAYLQKSNQAIPEGHKNYLSLMSAFGYGSIFNDHKVIIPHKMIRPDPKNGNKAKWAAARLLILSELHRYNDNGKHQAYTEVDHFSSYETTRFISIPENGDLENIKDVNLLDLYIDDLSRVTTVNTTDTARAVEQLVELNEKLFIQYPNDDTEIDTNEAMHHLYSTAKIEGIERINVGTADGAFFFRYNKQKIIDRLPEDANAFLVIRKAVNSDNDLIVDVQYYKVKADYETRIRSREEIKSNVELMVNLFAA